MSSGPVERHRQKKGRNPMIMMLLCRPYQVSKMSMCGFRKCSPIIILKWLSRDFMDLFGLI